MLFMVLDLLGWKTTCWSQNCNCNITNPFLLYYIQRQLHCFLCEEKLVHSYLYAWLSLWATIEIITNSKSKVQFCVFWFLIDTDNFHFQPSHPPFPSKKTNIYLHTSAFGCLHTTNWFGSLIIHWWQNASSSHHHSLFIGLISVTHQV